MTNYPVVRARLIAEINNMDMLYEELNKKELFVNNSKVKEKLNDMFFLRAVGSVFHDFYTSAENMFKTIARDIDKSIPDNKDWHIELLQQMYIEIDGTRPAVISKKTFELLNEYRGFRHIFRNVYGFNLTSERMEYLLSIFPKTVDNIKSDTKNFVLEMDSAVLP
jgi:hypothetical protein